jgi:hypothetical protein
LCVREGDYRASKPYLQAKKYSIWVNYKKAEEGL